MATSIGAKYFAAVLSRWGRNERAATHPSEADARLSCGGAPCVQTEVTRRVTRERGTGWFWGVAAAEMVVGVGSASTR